MTDFGLAIFSGVPAAPGFYTMAPLEPIVPSGTLRVRAAGKIVLRRNATAVGLLDVLVRQASKVARANVLLVTHGVDEGLSIPLFPRGNAMIQRNALEVLAENEAGKRNDTDAAKVLGTGPEVLRALKAKLANVRSLRMRRLEIRACSTGQVADVLTLIRNFFGAESVTAPQLFDLFAVLPSVRPTNDDPTWEKWLREHRGAVIEGASPRRFALRVDVSGGGAKVDWLADSQTAIKDWVDRHFPGNVYKEGPVYMHGFVGGTGVQKPVFPGDSGFRDRLTRVP